MVEKWQWVGNLLSIFIYINTLGERSIESVSIHCTDSNWSDTFYMVIQLAHTSSACAKVNVWNYKRLTTWNNIFQILYCERRNANVL